VNDKDELANCPVCQKAATGFINDFYDHLYTIRCPFCQKEYDFSTRESYHKVLELVRNPRQQFRPGKCIRKHVVAILRTNGGHVYVGTNYCEANPDFCPRQSMASGVGYELCKTVCKQGAHAEIAAINEALKHELMLAGSTIFLMGHEHCCENCTNEMKKYGISKVVFVNDGFKAPFVSIIEQDII